MGMVIAMIIVGSILVGLFWGFPLVLAGSNGFKDPEANIYAVVIFGIGAAIITAVELILYLVGLAFHLF